MVCGADHATAGPQAEPSVLAAGLRGKRGPTEPSESWAPRDPPVPRLASPIVRCRPPLHPASSVTPPPVDSPDGRFLVVIYAPISADMVQTHMDFSLDTIWEPTVILPWLFHSKREERRGTVALKWCP